MVIRYTVINQSVVQLISLNHRFLGLEGCALNCNWYRGNTDQTSYRNRFKYQNENMWKAGSRFPFNIWLVVQN